MKNIALCVLIVMLVIGCKNPVVKSNNETVITPEDTPTIHSLARPEIILSYKTEPSTTKSHCDKLVKAGYTWDMYILDELGSGTIATLTSTETDCLIYYTLDGSEPTQESQLYTEPFEIITKCEVKAKAFRGDETSEILVEKINCPYGKSTTHLPTTWGNSHYDADEFGLYIVFESLPDKSGPDFSKQHYIIIGYEDLEWYNVPNGGILTFDSYTENNFYKMLGSTLFPDNADTFDSKGEWTGTLWLKDIYTIDGAFTGNPEIYAIAVLRNLSQPSYL